MNHRTTHIVWITLICVFAAFKWMETSFVLPALMTSHFEDLLFIPLLLLTTRVLLSLLNHRWKDFEFGSLDFLLVVAVVSIWFELVMPAIKPGVHIADVFDVGCYLIGAMLYRLITQLARKTSRTIVI